MTGQIEGWVGDEERAMAVRESPGDAPMKGHR